MKNKILRIFVVFCCLVLILCSLFTVGVSAYNLPTGNGYFSVSYSNINNVPYSSITLYNWDLEFADIEPLTGYLFNPSSVVILTTENGVQYIDSFLGKFPLQITNFNDGVYLLVSVFEVGSDVGAYMTFTDGSHLTNIASGTAEFMGNTGDFNIMGVDTNNLSFSVGQLSEYAEYDYHYTLVLWDLEVPLNGGSSGTCPTLQEQLNSYTGTWENFVMMLDDARLNGNDTFTQGLQAERQYYYTSGQDNVKTVLNNKTTFEQFINQLTTYNMTNAVDVLEDHVLEEFNNGIDAGYNQGYEQGTIVGSEAGYRNGYNTGYNKGASDELVGNFFLDLFNAPISILNSIVIYQITDGGTPGDTSDDVNITVWGVLVVAVIISLFLILLKIFAGG